VPVLAKVKTDIARIWTYVRDDKPFGGSDPPAALFYYARDRRGEHPVDHLRNYSGILQADAYSGYNELFKPARQPQPLTRALCWAHARRKFFELADIAAQMKRRKTQAIVISPLAAEAVKCIDAILEIERDINGRSADERLAVRQEQSAPLVEAFEHWLREARATLSRSAPVAKAMDYMLRDWPAFTGFLHDGRICLTNNAAERALRGIALGRRSWLFAGSDRGGQRAAFMYTLIVTAKLNNIDPQVWLVDVLARIASISQNQLHNLLPWNWTAARTADQNLARAA
jgi:transposase